MQRINLMHNDFKLETFEDSHLATVYIYQFAHGGDIRFALRVITLTSIFQTKIVILFDEKIIFPASFRLVLGI